MPAAGRQPGIAGQRPALPPAFTCMARLWWMPTLVGIAGQRPARPGGAADRPVKPPVGKVAPDPGNPDNAQKPDGPPRSAFSVSGPSIAGRSPFGAALQVLASPATVYPSAAPMAATNRGARHGSVCRSVGCPVGR
ncbi:hypothetical protein Smlt3593 [Stenotrophomonas maltophilia K279a]|uniref:Uncharacterized protein n=1 Tax=Stenotrophomonas maltophilia (strain K279a) TaxID=522373 RepID=B2FQG1_STRMK|nr:hypothetical protein Smlt3593 [Stenotrophomonas maltophilia K279a]